MNSQVVSLREESLFICSFFFFLLSPIVNIYIHKPLSILHNLQIIVENGNAWNSVCAKGGKDKETNDAGYVYISKAKVKNQ